MSEIKYYNSITVSLKYALLLSEHTSYFKAYYELKEKTGEKVNREKGWQGTDWGKVFGLGHAIARKIAHGDSPAGAAQEEKIITATNKFIESVRDECGEEHKLTQSLKQFELGDLSIVHQKPTKKTKRVQKMIGEESVWALSNKLELTKAQTYFAIDKFRNVIAKENCGTMLSGRLAASLFRKAEGVYFLIVPSSNIEPDKVRIMTMRVGFLLSNQDGEGACIRVKINVKNIFEDDPLYRFHYRGELIPSNMDHCWTISVGQAPYTVNIEEALLGKKIRPADPFIKESDVQSDEHILHIADDIHIQLSEPQVDGPVSGLLSSLGQRSAKDKGLSTRVPFSAVIVAQHIFKDSFSDEEQAFMREAIGEFASNQEAERHLSELVNTDTQRAKLERAFKTYEFLKEKYKGQMLFKCPRLEDM